MTDKKFRRVSLDLSRSAFDRLTALEEITEYSKVDMIRDALRLYEYLVRQSAKGSKIQCVSPDGDVTEVIATSLPTPANEELIPA